MLFIEMSRLASVTHANRLAALAAGLDEVGCSLYPLLFAFFFHCGKTCTMEPKVAPIHSDQSWTDDGDDQNDVDEQNPFLMRQEEEIREKTD